MEANQYFSIFILSMCAVHLAMTVGNHVRSWWLASVGKRYFSRQSVGLHAVTKKSQRGDWYVFFHCSDLVGKESLPKSDSLPVQPQQKRPPVRRSENRITLT